MATPETKTEAPKETEREKKRGGLFARLFGGAPGGTAGFGGLGGAGTLGDLLAGSGLLATKSGLLALILVGASVAGGVGWVGYHLLGLGAAQPSAESVSLFAQKPKEDASPEVDPVPVEGSSQSFKFFSKANTNPNPAETASAGTPQDATAAGAAVADAAAGTGPAAPGAASTDNGVNKNLLKAPKIGELSGAGGGAPGKGGSAAGAGGALKAGLAGADLSGSSHPGASSSMKKGLASAGGVSSHGRGFGNNGALGQAFGAMHDNRSATSSAAGGTTYDGSAPSGTNGGGLASIAPAGSPEGASQPTNLPAAAAGNPDLAAPPTPAATEEAPWQNAIHTAQMLIALSVALMLVAKLLSKTGYGHIVAMVIAAVVASLGAMVIALGAQIAGGQYGQKLQGGVLAAAGVGLMVMAAATAFGGKGDAAAGDSDAADGLNSDGYTADDPPDSGSDAGGMFGNIDPLVLVGGGAALVGLAGSMMAPPTKYPSSTFQNGNPPDTHFFGYREAPSETALKKMVA